VTVVAIHLGEARNPELWPVESVRAVAGKGLEGDRYFFEDGAEPGGRSRSSRRRWSRTSGLRREQRAGR
jgi:hypothetical protein